MGASMKLPWLFAVALLTTQRCAAQAPTNRNIAAGSSVYVQRMDRQGIADGAAQELCTKDQVDASITAALATV